MSSNTNIGYWEQVLHAPTPAYEELFREEAAYLVEKIEPEMYVLDIGCGDGRNMKTILQNTQNVEGLDMDVQAVNECRLRFKDIPTVKITPGEANNLPYANNIFDVVTLLMILPNLDDQKVKAFQEAARVLKEDGILILSTFSETAFDERMKIYKQVNAPIIRIEGTKFIFDKSLGANISEQFSIPEIESLASQANLKISDYKKVGDLAYLCTLTRL